MAITNKHLTYRGDLRELAGFSKGLAFITEHPDSVATPLYVLDIEKLELRQYSMSPRATALASDKDSVWVAGDDLKLYRLSGKAKSLSTLDIELPGPVDSLICLSSGLLAALQDEQLLIIDAAGSQVLQTLELPEKGSSIAADPTGSWLAVGTSKGHVCVFQAEESDAFQLSETEKLHEGAVTSLLFEPEELRFFSAGADQKLLLTHARGKLEPEDRGRGASHSDHVTALMHVPGERFVSVSRDKSCKTWAREGATRPATFDNSVPAVVDAVCVEIHGRHHIVIAGQDNTLRFILLDAGGRFSSMTSRLYDAYDRASSLLDSNDVSLRGEAISALASYDDSRSVELLATQVDEDPDPALRLRCTELLAASQHPRASKLLEPILKHRDDKVRMAALGGLQNAAGKDSLRPLSLAIGTGKVNIGVAATETLGKLAKKDEQALQLLVSTLSKEPEEVRRSAMLQLEGVFPKNSPDPCLIGLKSSQADTRQLALVRSFHRKLLTESRIQNAIRRSGEDSDANVRRTAFLVSLLSRGKLADAIRQRDKELHRQLFELETARADGSVGGKAKQPPKLKPAKFSLKSEDYEPLLSAMASRALDTCLLGARCLALLGDPRAFGTLLQLSREEDDAARVQVCQALSALDDPRASQRLETLLNDSATEVRDAAYSSLESLHQKTPLEAADVGLSSAHVEVRRRALKTLVGVMRKASAKSKPNATREMLLRALNDSDSSVSGEAFKSVLGLKIDGSTDATLRFALQSVRSSVRREVLTEVMAHDKQDWAKTLLADFLNDPAAKIRDDAYDHLLSQKKGRDVAPMKLALESRHSDVRLRATQSLIKLKTKAANEALVTAISDDAPEVRRKAVEALIHADAVDVLRQAMSSKHSDVRLQAACARALFHDDQAKTPLIQTATAQQPEKETDRPAWQHDAVIALGGLGTLGQKEFVPLLLPLLDSDVAEIREAAASSVASCAHAEYVESLKPYLQHEDPKVRFRIALGLAYCQDAIALPLVFSSDAGGVLSDGERLMASVAMGEPTETLLATMLDSETAWIRNASLLILLMRDWRSHDGTPARVLTALSAQDPRIRFSAAKALGAFANPDDFAAMICEFVNDRGEDPDWAIDRQLVESLADGIVFADPQCQAQLVAVLEMLEQPEQEAWNFAWSVRLARYQETLASAKKTGGKAKLPKLKSDPAELTQLAFGTYVGLVREQGSYHTRSAKPSFGSTVIAIRQAAIGRLVEMASADETMAAATRPVLIQALGDKIQAVRSLAFSKLPEVGVGPDVRAAAAMECGHTDLAVEALKLLTEGAGKGANKILEDAVLSRDDELATEAGMLLHSLAGPVVASVAGLDSPHERTRMIAVGWLAAAYEEHAKAKGALVKAYDSRYDAVKREVAIALAAKKDKHAFDMLIEQLPHGLTRHIRRRVLNALAELGDSRSPKALIALIESDDQKVLDSGEVFSTIGSFRQADCVDQMLELLERQPWQEEVADAIVAISGYDQGIEDPEDELPHRNWMSEQHPRHDAVLASYLQRCLDLNLPNLIQPRIEDARWSLGDDVDGVLRLLASHPDDDLRNEVTHAIGWRLKHRAGPADGLLELLEHRDATTRFLAAAGLALGGRNEGINLLLSSVELMSDLSHRILAVRALGELADERSLDILLRLASEDGHALQDTAAEAVGHLRESEKADEVFDLLKRLSNQHGTVGTRAIIGLRLFDSPSGWDIIRHQVSYGVNDSAKVIEQLGYNDDPATKELLLKLLKGWYPDTAMGPAKRIFGEDSLEPDFAVLQSEDGYYAESYIEETYHCLQRVCRDGEPEKILEVLESCSCQSELSSALLKRDPLPVNAAVAALDSSAESVVEVAASIIGRAGKKEHGKAIGKAIEAWLPQWQKHYQAGLLEGWWEFGQADEAAQTLVRLAWAGGQILSAKAELMQLVEANVGNQRFVTVRRSALVALGNCKLTKAELEKIETLTTDLDASIRQSAADILSRQAPARASAQAANLLSDRSVFRRLQVAEKVDVGNALNEAAKHAHYQAVALPLLVSQGNVDRLGEVACDPELAESTRIGAIEGLARVSGEAANEKLVSIGTDESSAEDIRKAAWRGLRRSKRSQSK